MAGLCDPRRLEDRQKRPSKDVRDKNDKLMEAAIIKFQNDPVLKKFGYTDLDTFRWLFNEKVGLTYDVESLYYNAKDIKKLDRGITEFKSSLEGPDGVVGSYLKIPRRLLSRAPEAREFVDNIELIMSHYKEHTNEPLKDMNVMLDNFSQLAIEFGIKGKEQKQFTDLEGRYRMAMAGYNANPNSAKGKKYLQEATNLWGEVMLRLGTRNDLTGRTALGEMYLGLRDVLEGVTTIKDLTRTNGKEWNPEHKLKMEKIVTAYDRIRKQAAVNAINGLNVLKKMVTDNGNKDLFANKNILRVIEKYDKIIKTLEFQQDVDASQSTESYFNRATGEFKEVGLDGKVLQRKYMPHYVLDAVRDIHSLMDVVHSGKGYDKAVQEFEARLEKFENPNTGIIDRLKNRDPLSKEEYSVDPFYFLNKYIYDIARFNMSANINYNYQKATQALTKRVIESGNATEVQALAKSLLETMGRTYDTLLGERAQSHSGLENMTRFITAVEHTAKMGGNFRSAIRNLGQKVFNWVHMGGQAINFSKEFYSGANSDANLALVHEAMTHHGISWEAKIKDKIQGVENMTYGAVENVDPGLPTRYKIVDGRMVDAGITVGDRAVKGANWLAEKTSFMHRKVENMNRQETFKIAFALAYNNYTSGGMDFIKREMVREGTRKEGQEVTDQSALKWAARKSGNLAYHSVLDLHFDYSPSGKPQLLRHKAGRIFGQYQHYRFSLIDLQMKWVKDARRAFGASDYSGQEMQRMYRLGALYSGISGLSVLTNMQIGNLIANDTFQMSRQWWDFLTADAGSPEGKLQMEKSFFGVGPVAGTVGGPLVSDVMTLGEIVDLWSLNEYGVPGKASAYKKAFSENKDKDKLYDALRVFNGQAARIYKHSGPAFLKGDVFQALKIESGLYPSKWTRDWRKWGTKKLGLDKYEAFGGKPTERRAPGFNRGSLSELTNMIKKQRGML